jgi:hypothetical protein
MWWWQLAVMDFCVVDQQPLCACNIYKVNYHLK